MNYKTLPWKIFTVMITIIVLGIVLFGCSGEPTQPQSYINVTIEEKSYHYDYEWRNETFVFAVKKVNDPTSYATISVPNTEYYEHVVGDTVSINANIETEWFTVESPNVIVSSIDTTVKDSVK